jgi:hypothetical protein
MSYMSNYQRSRYPSSHPIFTGTGWISPEEQRRQHNEYHNSHRTTEIQRQPTTTDAPMTWEEHKEHLRVFLCLLIGAIVVGCIFWYMFNEINIELEKMRLRHPDWYRVPKFRNVHHPRRFL